MLCCLQHASIEVYIRYLQLNLIILVKMSITVRFARTFDLLHPFKYRKLQVQLDENAHSGEDMLNLQQRQVCQVDDASCHLRQTELTNVKAFVCPSGQSFDWRALCAYNDCSVLG